MGAQARIHASIMRSFIIGSVLLLSAIACAAEMTPEDTTVSEDFQVPTNELMESSPATALEETEADIASSTKTKSKAASGFWRRRRRRLRCEEETLVQKADKAAKTESLVVSRSGNKASAGFWRRRRRYVHPCQGIWNERA